MKNVSPPPLIRTHNSVLHSFKRATAQVIVIRLALETGKEKEGTRKKRERELGSAGKNRRQLVPDNDRSVTQMKSRGICYGASQNLNDIKS